MKILHVYKDFYPPVAGGVERHISLMCKYQRRWAEVEALVCRRGWSSRVVERDGIRVTEVGEWGRFQSAPVSPLFPLYLKRLEADVVIMHAPNPTAELSWLIARPRRKLIVRYHSDVVRQARSMMFYAPFQMKFLAQADMILPTSRQYLDTSPTLQRFHERCRVMPLGIDTAAFETCDPQLLAEVRARYGESYVLFVGRHRYYKGIEYLVRAAPHIRAKVVIAGDGPERKRCQALAQKAGGDVEFPGELTHEELKAHLHGCAVFAFPSIVRSEAFGLSLLEAHACGKPTVATKLGTGVEFVSLDGETGLNVPPHDPGALAAAVNRLLDDSELRRRLGEAALRRVKSEFEAERVARAEFDLYQEVLG